MNQSIQAAIQTNKDHQYALKVYTERLEAELATAEKLLVVSFSYEIALHGGLTSTSAIGNC